MDLRPFTIRIQLAFKRVADIVCSGAALVLLAPVFAAIVIAIMVEDPTSPLFFNDWVVGRGCARFRLLKFRTMVPHEIDYRNRPEVHTGSPLVTRVGSVLRRYKLDELPQLWSVFRGDMSLVGPRPMDPVRYEGATTFQRQRVLVRPGLTGWAQINGNIHWSWPERMEMDIWYVDQWSLALDFSIIIATIPAIVRGERRCEQPPARITDHEYRMAWPGYGRIRNRR